MKLRLGLFVGASLLAGCLAEQGADGKDTSRTEVAPDTIEEAVADVVEPAPDVTVPGPEVASEVSREVDVEPDVVADVEHCTGPGRDHPTQEGGLTLVVGVDGVAAQTVVPLSVDVAAGAAAPERVQWWAYLPHAPNAIVIGEGVRLDFTANFVGEYAIVAEVTRGDGELVRLSSHLLIVAGGGLHVELSWQTPGDANETDVSDPFDIFSAGSDVDLHFVSPKAGSELFGSYDCYFANPNPEWGIFSPVDNPRLDRDDTDGAGPEIMRLDVPEIGGAYTVAVHYYDDWGYGDAYATLRIFVDGVLVDEWADVGLDMDDMWLSHTITDGVVSRIGTEPSITPSYYYDDSGTPGREP